MTLKVSSPLWTSVFFTMKQLHISWEICRPKTPKRSLMIINPHVGNARKDSWRGSKPRLPVPKVMRKPATHRRARGLTKELAHTALSPEGRDAYRPIMLLYEGKKSLAFCLLICNVKMFHLLVLVSDQANLTSMDSVSSSIKWGHTSTSQTSASQQNIFWLWQCATP